MKNIKVWYAIGAAIFLLGIIGSLWMLHRPTGNEVLILQDGEILYRINLAAYDGPETIEIAYNGGSNTVQIKDGRIRISEADCQDQTCVEMGWLDSSALPIVCLPHHLVIRYAEDDGSGVDAVSG